ncbi:MAG: HEAT repeat domain-containing protein [Candidatus Thermoplasmatota archaeon]|jgi:hypothetical protein|nr:HEAT repeat domain-containing protein [Candidatus Thermoplasmatota archaeon]
MSLKTLNKLVKNSTSSNPKKKVQALEGLEELCRENPQYLKNIMNRMVPLLEDNNERVKLIASVLLYRQSSDDAKGMTKQFRQFLKVLESAFDSKNQSSVRNWKPYTNIILTLGNIIAEYPKLGGKIAPVITSVLRYPLYRPQNPTKDHAFLYVASIKALGNIGRKEPGYVEESIPYIYKSLVDSYRFDFWNKSTADRDSNMRLHAANALKKVGRIDPSLVIPKIIPVLSENDKNVVNVGKDILLSFSKETKGIIPALVKSLNTEKQEDRERVTEFIVELGNKDPDQVMPILTRALSDSRRFVRIQAFSAVGSLLPKHTKYIPSIIPVLIKNLVKESDNEIKQSISDTLTIMSFLNINIFQKIMPYIIKALSDDYYHVRWRMCQIIKNVGIFKPQFVVDSIPHLITGLNDPYTHVQAKAKEALDALKVDKLEYIQAIKCIASGTKSLEKAKKGNISCMEGQNALMSAIKAAKEYRFRESISLSTTALDFMEAAGVPLSRYDAGSRYVAGQYLGQRDLGFGPDGLPIPPPPDEAIPLPPSAAQSPFGGGILEAKQVELAESKGGAGIDEIFLMTTYGILLDHYVASKKSKVDEEILAGMLVAVKSFITDSFDLPDAVGGGKMALNNIDFGDFSVVISTGRYLTMVAITTSGNRDAIYKHITSGIEKIENKFNAKLKTWDGDIDDLEGLPDYMKKVILD